MRRSISGFTIVELLIVIVVIAVLASITTVAYNGISNRAKLTSMKSDFSAIQRALELYKADHGHYPISPEAGTPGFNCHNHWCGWDQATGDAFIRGLSPDYIEKIPQLPTANENSDTFVYQSRENGKHYQLLRYKEAGLDAFEINGNELHLTGVPWYDGRAWGHKTNNDPDEPGVGDLWW